MRPLTILGVAAVVTAGVAFVSYDGLTNTDTGVSRAEQEAAANDPLSRTENEIQRNQTISENVAEAPAELDLNTASEAAGDAPTQTDLLTVDGYDPNPVRLLLVETDMSADTRNTYLQRLERALGDEDKLAAVLTELRAEIGPEEIEEAMDRLPTQIQ